MLYNYCMQETGNHFQICQRCSPVITTDKYSRRRYFSAQCKRDTLEEQNHKCGDCGERYTRNNRVQYHHDDEDRENDDCENCVALHAGCHDAITRDSHKRGNNGNDGYDDDDGDDDDGDVGAGWAKRMQSQMDDLSRIG